jgi:Undecaprenyl-phosphate galactose phosphotransferase WbaP
MESDIKRIELEQMMLALKAKGDAAFGPLYGRMFMSSALIGSDILMLLLSGWLAVLIRTIIRDLAIGIPKPYSLSLSPYFDPSYYFQLIPIVALFIVVYASLRIYPTVGLSRVDEMRILTISTSIVVTTYATILFLSQQGLIYSRFVFGLFWILAVILVPLGRVAIRNTFVHFSCWGIPVGIVGVGIKTERITDFLCSHPNLGFRPRVVFGNREGFNPDAGNLPVISHDILKDEGCSTFLKHLDTLVIVQADTAPEILKTLACEVDGSLPRIMMMPDLPEIGSIWVQPVDLGGVLALEIRNNLANPWQQFQKRAVDLTLAGVGSLLTLPLFGLIALAIKLDSHGPIIYSQRRVGKDGKIFPMLKFRTMYVDAEERLEIILSEDPDRKAEWEKYQKLTNDPRVTRVGSWLRSYSLDELPQLWNILRGEMSVVGPRPFIPAQKALYGDSYGNYKEVRPGITGMWQIGGRNKSSFSERARMDEYYVRNWSVWLDFYILARTPIVVLSRDGAY